MEETAIKFKEVFLGLDRAHGIYEITGQKSTAKGIKKDGKGRTLQEPLTLDLWQDHLKGNVSIGVIPLTDDETCKWGCIDVDEYPIDIKNIQSIIKDMGLPLVPCMTKSGGVHLFLFTKTPIPAFKLQGKLEEIAAAMGRTGDEIFPKQYEWSKQLPKERQTGNWLNMPYFGGEDTTRYALTEDGEAASMEEFFEIVEKASITEKEIDKYVPVKKSRRKLIAKEGSIWDEAPPCLVHMKLNGIPEGMRNNALLNYGVFLRKVHPESEEWKDKLQEINKSVCTKALSHSELNTIIQSLEKSDYRYQCNKAPLVDFCQSGICVTRRYGIDASERDPNFGGLRKYLTDPPLWHLDVDGRTIVLDTKQLHNFSMFQQRCMEVLNQCPPDVKKSDWVARLNALLQEVQEVDVPLDMTKQGLLQAAVHEFCRLSESSSRLAIASSGVYRHEDDGEKQWWFTGRDVVIFIQEFKKMRTIKEAEVFTELKEMGAANISKYIDKSVGNKKIWVLDIEELNEETILNKDFKIKEESKPWEE
tara:strand:- start:1017 stop:2609 length:1593 start_codon:yes stop_codon:yes gene_type:complete